MSYYLDLGLGFGGGGAGGPFLSDGGQLSLAMPSEGRFLLSLMGVPKLSTYFLSVGGGGGGGGGGAGGPLVGAGGQLLRCPSSGSYMLSSFVLFMYYV